MSTISRNLSNYYRDVIDNIKDSVSDGKWFKYKTPARHGNERDVNWPAVLTLKVEVTIFFKHLNKFGRFRDLLSIKCEIELTLSWTEDCVLIEHYNTIIGVNVMISITKLYVPVAFLSINDNMKLLENITQGFKRIIV